MLGQLASPCSVATRDSLSKLSLSAHCSRAFQALTCIFLSFKHLHSPLCACSQDRNLLRDSSKLSQANLENIPEKKLWKKSYISYTQPSNIQCLLVFWGEG